MASRSSAAGDTPSTPWTRTVPLFHAQSRSRVTAAAGFLMPPRSVLIIRPGALGDALLTLPVLRALPFAGAQRLTILGTPLSWAFLSPRNSMLRVRDVGAADWLGLFAEGAPLSAPARETLSQADTALVYLGAGRRLTEKVLKAAGLSSVIGIEPPKRGQRAPGGPAAGIGPHHAARLLLDPLAAFLSASTLERDRARLVGKSSPTSSLRRSRGKRPAPFPRESGAASGDGGLPATRALMLEKFLAQALCADEFASLRDLLLGVTGAERARVAERLGLSVLPQKGFLAVHPGSGGRAKCWPAERFARLIEGAARSLPGSVPLVLFGPADEAARAAFDAAWPSSASISLRRIIRWPLRDILILLRLTRVFVGNDSGITHLAARCCPTLALFGPTDPRVWRPLGPRVKLLTSPARNGAMAGLTLEKVRGALEALWQGVSPRPLAPGA